MRKQLYSALAAVSLVAAWGPGACAKDPPAGLDLARQLNRAFEDVAERVSPAVVVINVVQKTASPSSEGEEDDSFQGLPPGFWRKFHEQFKRQMPDESRSEGSGIIIRDNGYILTNGHVIQDAESIQVRLHDGRVFKGVPRGIDSQSDVAVIKIEAGGLPVAKLGDSNKTRVGEFAIAIGAPFSLDYSVTFGHISAKSRSVIEGYEGAGMDQDFLQTDALINPGNSGGPLLNIEGEVIGINTLIRGLHTGIAFAIPSNLAREVADQIIAYGRFSRPWLGIYIQSLRENADLRQQFRDINDGVVISRILPKGPAGKSNLKPTDVILAIDGQHVSTAEQLRAAIREKKIGRPVRLDVFRDGKTIEVSVSPGEYADPTPVAMETKTPTKGPAGALADLGITVKPLTGELAGQFGVDTARGVVIAAVERDSPAGRKGLKPGEIITSINRRQISSPKEFREALKTLDLDNGVLVELLSSEAARFEILKRTEP